MGAKQAIYDYLDNLTKSGTIFSACFIKANGEERIMNCRRGVKKDLKGVGPKFDYREKRILPVYDMNKKGYRSIKTDSLIWIKIAGHKYNIEQL